MQHDRGATHFLSDKKYDSDNPPIVVVGAGIAGSIVALGAAAKGYPVVMITKYPYPVRPQEIYLKSSEIKFLEKHFKDATDANDIKFFRKLNNNTASLKSIERFLQRKLMQAREKGDIHYMDETDGELIAVNKENLTVSVKDERGITTIPFRHVVDASGTTRTAFMLTADTEGGMNRERDEIEEPLEFQLPHPTHGTTKFHLKKPDDTLVELRDKSWTGTLTSLVKMPFVSQTIHFPKFSKQEIQQLKNMFGWEENYQPTIYIITDEKRKKFYVGGEIPAGMLNDKIMVEAWSRHVLMHHFVIDESHLIVKNQYGNKRDKMHRLFDNATADRVATSSQALQVTSFPMRLTRLKDPVQDLSKDHDGNNMLVAIGDAVQNPYFLKAHGGNDASRGARKFLAALPPNNNHPKFHVKQFSEFVNAQREEHHVRTKNVNATYTKKAAPYPEKRSIPLASTTRHLISQLKSTTTALSLYLQDEIYKEQNLDEWVLVGNEQIAWGQRQPKIKERSDNEERKKKKGKEKEREEDEIKADQFTTPQLRISNK